MTDKATRLTESLIEATTRRGFLGRLARVAGGAAAGVAAILASDPVQGARPDKKACYYACPSGDIQLLVKYVPVQKDCPKKWQGCLLYIG